MKIQQSDICRFLELALKMWRSNYEGDSQLVVFTFAERSCSIATARDGLLLTYLCNRVDSEASEQAVALPLGLLQDRSNGTKAVALKEVTENGENQIVAEWSDGLAQCSRRYPVQDPPEYHLLPDLAWHTVDERLVRMLRSTETGIDGEKRATNRRAKSCPIEPVALVRR